jgi:cytochrome c
VRLSTLIFVVVLGHSVAALAAGDAERGETLWESRCFGCHSLDANRVGPLHRGVHGRVAGTAAGYAYSPGVAKSGITWNDETLDRWLANPQAYIAGAKMGFRVPDATDRADLIAYLRKESGK